MKNIPGPLAPPLRSRPSLKMTTRSYSCTTLMQKKKDIGRVNSTSMSEKAVRRMAHTLVGSPLVADESEWWEEKELVGLPGLDFLARFKTRGAVLNGQDSYN